VAVEVGRGLSSARDLELGEDAQDEVLDRLLGQAQLVADLPVRLTVGDEREEALLLGRQPDELLVLSSGVCL
jgi:hypothetical protein